MCRPRRMAFGRIYLAFTAFFGIAFDTFDTKKTNLRCPIENYYEPRFSSALVLYHWDAIQGDGIYSSTPLCLDVSYNIVQRHCLNGTWQPHTISNCYSFECPKPFVAVKKDVCLLSSTSKNCPNLQSFFANYSQQIGNDLNHDAKWTSHDCTYRTQDFLIASDVAGKIEVLLNFDARKSKLYLTVYSPEALETSQGKDAVYCFASDFDLVLRRHRKLIHAKNVYDSRLSDGFYQHVSFRNFSVWNLEIDDGPREYWCQIFEVGKVRPVVTSRVVAYKRKYGGEYAVHVVIRGDSQDKKIEKFCSACRIMEVLNYEVDATEYLLHLTTNESSDLSGKFRELKAKLANQTDNEIQVLDIKSTQFCFPDVITSGNQTLNWRLTPYGSISLPLEICLDANRSAVSRKCGGDFLHGAEWEKPSAACLNVHQTTHTTKLLNKVFSEFVSFNNYLNSTVSYKNYSTVDVAVLAEALRQYSNLTVNLLKVTSEIMTIDKNILKESQVRYNSTDKILDSLENFLNNQYVVSGSPIIVEQNLIVATLKPFENDTVGLLLYKNKSGWCCYIKYICKNQTMTEVAMENLEVAVIVPSELLLSLSERFTHQIIYDFRITITVFKNDKLFQENNGSKRAGSKIVSVTMTNYSGYLDAPILLYFKPLGAFKKSGCGFWDYGNAKQGTWSSLGSNFAGMEGGDFVQCYFSHLTHMSLLVLSEETVPWETVMNTTTALNLVMFHDSYLTAITLLGCILSIAGIVAIFLTAALFKQWRAKVGTKLLLQFSTVILLEIVLTQLAGIFIWPEQEKICTYFALALHYIVLAKFCSMFVIAYLQYLRFVTIITALPSHLLLKASLISFVLPIVPIAVSFYLYPSNYEAGELKFCYVKGRAFYFGLIAPIAVVAVANVAIFCKIILSIITSKIRIGKSVNVLQLVKLAVLLFFMLGLPWVFGLMAEMSDVGIKTICLYLFCLTATLQGFVAFIFFVVLDDDTKSHWSSVCCWKKRVQSENVRPVQMAVNYTGRKS